MFSDEKNFGLQPETIKLNDRICALIPEEVSPVEVSKFPSIVMVWGFIARNGVEPLIFVDEKINLTTYTSILKNNAIPRLNEMFGEKQSILQQDGATPHTSKITQVFLQENRVNFISKEDWPPNSPNINPIEDIWGVMVQELNKTRIRTADG